MKRTGILLYRGNLKKGEIYIRRIYNTDRKSFIIERREGWGVFYNERKRSYI